MSDNQRFNKGKRKENRKKDIEGLFSTVCIGLSIVLIMGVLVYNGLTRDNNSNDGNLAADMTQSAEHVAKSSKLALDAVLSDTTDATANQSEATADNTKESQSNTSASKKEDEKTDTSVSAQTAVLNLEELLCPVSTNKITMAFSYGTTPVFSKTLGEYRSDHTGADIASGKGEEVKAAADGKVIAIADDDKLGTLITIDHGNKIYTLYGNLQKKASVKVNDLVKKGQIIGKTGDTAAFEASDASHVHFAIKKNGSYINPKDYIQ